MSQLLEALESFRLQSKITTKGRLSVPLYVTRIAKQDGLPLNPENLKAESGTQVAGLNKSPVQAILKDYGITKILAQEAGRTSRGSVKIMEDYVSILNDLNEISEIDLNIVEKWWVERIVDFFNSKPFVLKPRAGLSINVMIKDLINQAEKRQKDNPGTMYAGAIIQHLVGAKLEVIAGPENIKHHGFSVADESTGRGGDFFLGNTSIHVTTAPSESLMNKCKDNINAGYRVFVVTVSNKVTAAIQLADIKQIKDQIDIIDIEQFITTNIYEWSKFDASSQKDTIENLISIYNNLIETYETDLSLRVELN